MTTIPIHRKSPTHAQIKSFQKIPRPPPTPAQAQLIQNYKQLRKRGAKDSMDFTGLDENISVNKPRISNTCNISLSKKNQELADEIRKYEDKKGKRNYDIIFIMGFF